MSNLEQPQSRAQGTGNQILSQGFTTGSEPGGYTLSSIEVVLGEATGRRNSLRGTATGAQRADIRAELWSTSATGASGPGSIATNVDGPYSKIADLTVPSSVSVNSTVAFAAPANTTLAPDTPYHFVFYTVGPLQLAVLTTDSDNEDAGGQTGWSVKDGYWWEATDTPAFDPRDDGLFWTPGSLSLRIRVNGSALPPPSTPGARLSANPNPAPGGSQVTVTLSVIGGAALPEKPYLVISEGLGRAWWGTSPSYPSGGISSTHHFPSRFPVVGTREVTASLRIVPTDRGGDTIEINAYRAGGEFLAGPLTIRVLGSGSGGTPGTGGGGSGSGGGISAPTPTPTPTPPPTDQPATPRCGENDREDLVRLYDATDGDNWDDNTDWNSQEPLREWFGVDTDEDGEVVSLHLADNGLSGEMPTKELLCLNENTELKELALWDNEDLSGDVPDELVRAVERAVLREIAETLDINPEWFDDYEDPFSFEDWHEGVTTDEDGRVVELALPGEIPRSLSGQLKKLREIVITTSSSGGGCALSPEGSSAFSLFLLTLVVFAALVRKRAR